MVRVASLNFHLLYRIVVICDDGVGGRTMSSFLLAPVDVTFQPLPACLDPVIPMRDYQCSLAYPNGLSPALSALSVVCLNVTLRPLRTCLDSVVLMLGY